MTALKKITAFLISAIMLLNVLTLSSGAASTRAGATRYDSLSMLNVSNGSKTVKTYYYKMILPQKGIVSFESGTMKTSDKSRYVIYNADGKVLVSGKAAELTGKKITFSKKGTYYLSLRLLKGEKIKNLYYMYAAAGGKKVKEKTTLTVGKTYSLDCYTKGFSGRVKWRSMDKTIAKVTSYGNISALKVGKTELYAFSSGGDYAAVTLTVTDKAAVSAAANYPSELTDADISLLKKEFATFPYCTDNKYFTAGAISEEAAIDWLFDLGEDIIDPHSPSGLYRNGASVRDLGAYGFIADMIKVPEKYVDDLIYNMFGVAATHSSASDLWFYKDGFYYFQESGSGTNSAIDYDSYEKLGAGKFLAKFWLNKVTGGGSSNRQEVYAVVSVISSDGQNYIRIHSVAKDRETALS